MLSRLMLPVVGLCLVGSTSLASSFVNFESGHVRPVALSEDGALLFAVNTPDNRLEVFRVGPGGLERAGEAVVGLEPIAVAVRGASEAWVVNHLSDSVSVVDVTDPDSPFVRETLLVGDEPRDIVIGGPGHDRVFISAAHRGQNRPGNPQLTTPGVGRADVWVFAADEPTAAPDVLTFFSDTPRALAVSPDGARVYVAAFHSGNGTTALEALAVSDDDALNGVIGDGFTGLGTPAPTQNHEGIDAPEQSVIVKYDGERWVDGEGRDWTPRVRFDLPDRDVFEIDATQDPPVQVRSWSGAGTILFNLAVHPVSGDVYVTNLESRNDVALEPVLNGHVAENRVTILRQGGTGPEVDPVHLNPHIDYRSPHGPASEIAASLAFPLGMAFSASGDELFVAAFGSSTVAVLGPDATVQRRIAVGGGPSGLALDEAGSRLYVMQRFEHSIAAVDTTTGTVLQTVPLRFDPEPEEVRAGRPVLYDARLSSGHGDSACASCHVFGDFDSLAWNLGDPSGDVEPNPLVRVEVQGEGPLRDFHPLKGPMATQSLRGMLGAGAMHWRGDRNGGSAAPFDERAAFLEFRPAFEKLLGRETPLPLEEMEKLRDFILTVVYPPNPVAPIDGSLTTAQARGEAIFDSDGSRTEIGGDGDPCGSCHTLPLGTDGHGSFEGLPQDMKVAHLRNLYQKVGMFGYALPDIRTDTPRTQISPTPTPHLGEQVRGFGYLHDGTVPTLVNFFRFPLGQFTFPDDDDFTGAEKVADLVEFMLAFDTGLAPVVGQQTTLTAAALPDRLARYGVLRARAEAGACDLVVHGVLDGEPRGYLYTLAGTFQSDVRAETTDEDALSDAVRDARAVLTVTAVPPGSGRRIAIDRDEDGALDGDELAAGTDPADPTSVPSERSRLLRANCNGDGAVDLSDAVFTLNLLFSSGPEPPCDEACDANADGATDVSDPVFTLNFLFADGAPPGGFPACEEVRDGDDCATPVCP